MSLSPTSAERVPRYGSSGARPSRRRLLALLCLLQVPWLPATSAQQPFRLVVPAPAGGALDLVARALAEPLAMQLGQPVRVENIVGAGGLVGAMVVSRAPPDGSTIVVVHSGLVAAPTQLPRVDLLDDLVPVARTGRSPLVLVVRVDSPFTSLAGLIGAARSEPGRLSYASGGIGSPGYEAVVELAVRAKGFDAVHIPYGGAIDGGTALQRGDVDFQFGVLGAMLPLIAAGRVRALAVSSAGRVAVLPDVPTVAESGLPGFAIEPWAGIAAPAGTPGDTVVRLDAALRSALDAPAVRTLMARLGIVVDHAGPADFRRQIAREVEAQTARALRAGPKAAR